MHRPSMILAIVALLVLGMLAVGYLARPQIPPVYVVCPDDLTELPTRYGGGVT